MKMKKKASLLLVIIIKALKENNLWKSSYITHFYERNCNCLSCLNK